MPNQHPPMTPKTTREERPKIITICGSSRFCDLMAVCGWILERDEGAMVMGLNFLPEWYTSAADHLAEEEGVAEKMDALHLKKIDLSDEVFVVNLDGYIGDSTKNEIRHAEKLGKQIRWFEEEPIKNQILTIINRRGE